MHDQEKIHEASLPKKEDIYGHLNIKDITDAGYVHAETFYKDFETKNWGEYHKLHVQRDKLLVDVFENF